MRPRIVGVIGGSKLAPDPYHAAELIGHAAVLCRAVVVTGGLAGAIEAAANRAKATGDLRSGVLPGFSPQDANPPIDLPSVTGLCEARNLIIVRTAEVLIAIGGGPGTLSEIIFALKLHIPVISLDSRPVADEIIRGRTPQETADRALGLLDAMGPGGL